MLKINGSNIYNFQRALWMIIEHTDRVPLNQLGAAQINQLDPFRDDPEIDVDEVDIDLEEEDSSQPAGK